MQSKDPIIKDNGRIFNDLSKVNFKFSYNDY